MSKNKNLAAQDAGNQDGGKVLDNGQAQGQPQPTDRDPDKGNPDGGKLKTAATTAFFKDDDDPKNGATVDDGEEPTTTEEDQKTGKEADKEKDEFDSLFDAENTDEVLDKIFGDPENADANADVVNAKKMVKKATQKNMEIADERRQLDQDRSALSEQIAQVTSLGEQLKTMYGQMQTGMAAQPGMGTNGYDGADEFDFDIDGQPQGRSHESKIVRQLNQKVDQLEKYISMINMESKVSRIDRDLQAKYDDYDPKVVDTHIAQMDDGQLRAAVWKAQKFDGMDMDQIVAEAERRGAKKTHEYYSKLYKKRQAIGDPLGDTDAIGGDKKVEKGNWKDAAKRVSKYNLFK